MVIHPCGNRPRTEATNKQRTNPPLNPGRAGTTTPNPSQRSASFLKSLFSSGASSSSSSSKFPACQWSAQLPYHVAHCVKENLIIYPLGVSWEVWNCGCCAVFYVVPGFFWRSKCKKMLRRPCPNMMRCSTKGLTGRLPFAICIPGMAQVTRFYQHVATINRNLGEQEKPTETNRVAIRIWQICIQLQCLGAPTSYNSYRPLSPL